MELNLLKMLGALLSNMTITEAMSLLSIIGGAVWVAAKSALRFKEYIEKGKAVNNTGNNGNVNTNDTAHEQILIQLQMMKDKLLSLESKIDGQNFSMPKEMATELGHMFKKLEEIHQEQVSAHKEIGKTVSDNLDNIAVMRENSLDNIAVMREKIINIESSIPRVKADLKEIINEMKQKVENTSEKVGIMQGLITSNQSSRSGR